MNRIVPGGPGGRSQSGAGRRACRRPRSQDPQVQRRGGRRAAAERRPLCDHHAAGLHPRPDQLPSLPDAAGEPVQRRAQRDAPAVRLRAPVLRGHVAADLAPGHRLPGSQSRATSSSTRQEAPGGQVSTLTLGEVAGFGKLFSTGGQLLMGFANQVVFNFVGKNPIQPTVQSSLAPELRAAVPPGGGPGRGPGNADPGRAQPALPGPFVRQVPPGVHRRHR